MAEIGKSLKGIWLKSMEAISNTASSIASNTKFKVDEMNIVNRRREILSDFGARCYELWQKGETFPEPVDALLRELSDLDEALNNIRMEKNAGVKNEDAAKCAPAVREDDSIAAEDTEAGEGPTSAEDMADGAKNSVSEKIDNAMDAVGATFKKIGSKLGDGIEALTKAMKPRMEEKAENVADNNSAEEPAPVIVVEEPVVVEEEKPVSFEFDMPAQPTAPVISVEEDSGDPTIE